MAKAAQKITLFSYRDIPFDKLVLSQSNARRIKVRVSVDELTEDIARRGFLQSLSVRPVLANYGTKTGRFEIPAGGRRFQALSLLVKQKRLNKVRPMPCIRWTSSVPSWRCARRGKAMRRSRMPSSLHCKWSSSD